MTRATFTDAQSAVKTRDRLGSSLAERLQQATTPAQGTPKCSKDSRPPTESLGPTSDPSASPEGAPPADDPTRSGREPTREDLIAAHLLSPAEFTASEPAPLLIAKGRPTCRVLLPGAPTVASRFGTPCPPTPCPLQSGCRPGGHLFDRQCSEVPR
jgi:hypothetical protein